MHKIKIACVIVFCIQLSACGSVGYYWQSAKGHMSLMWKRTDIAELLEEDTLPQKLRDNLALAIKARRFAADELGLPDNGSYTQYVDTGQKYVVWNVFAAPEFSLDLKRHCFLFVGCVGYRGYYAEADAKAMADELSKQGFETYVSGAIAYSTLGWFDDPVLNTFIHYPEANLAGLIFHELAHQLLYIKSDAAFNEGFANMVEIEGVKRWLQAHPQSGDIERYRRYKRLRQQFLTLVTASITKLRELYQSELPDTEMRQRKRAIITQLREDYQRRKNEVQGFNVYEYWFEKDINNARLASVATYEDYVPAFQQLLKEHGGDLRRFYQAVVEISELDKDKRKQALLDLAKRAASAARS